MFTTRFPKGFYFPPLPTPLSSPGSLDIFYFVWVPPKHSKSAFPVVDNR